MCGRFNVESDPLSRLLLELVRLRHPGPDNCNAAPTETITVLRLDDDGNPELVPMRWWLDPDTATGELKPWLAPAIPEALEALPVSTYVNNARHKDRRCLEGVAAPVPVDP